MAFAPTYALLALSLFVLGLGAGILDMVLSPVVSALNPERRTVAMNWLHSFYCVGAVVTILAGTVVTAEVQAAVRTLQAKAKSTASQTAQAPARRSLRQSGGFFGR